MKRFIFLMAIVGTLLAIPATHLWAAPEPLEGCCVTGRHSNFGRIILSMPDTACHRLELFTGVACKDFGASMTGGCFCKRL